MVTVIAQVVVLPATSEFTPLLLETPIFADRVLVKVQLESALAGGLMAALRILPTRVVELGLIIALISSFKQVIAVTYFVKLVWAPEVSVTVTEAGKLG